MNEFTNFTREAAKIRDDIQCLINGYEQDLMYRCGRANPTVISIIRALNDAAESMRNVTMNSCKLGTPEAGPNYNIKDLIYKMENDGDSE